MTQQELNRTVFMIEDFVISEVSYKEYLRNYWADETTTPRGVAPRLLVEEQEDGTWAVRKWSGASGNRPLITISIHETEEEAELELYSHWEYAYRTSSSDAPAIFDTPEQGIREIADGLQRDYAVIERYMRLLNSRNIRQAEEKRLAKKQHQQEEEAMRKAVESEAAEIYPDADLFAALHQARGLKGEEKSKAIAAAQVAFLHRIGHYPISTDFWKVFKIVNKKSLSTIH